MSITITFQSVSSSSSKAITPRILTCFTCPGYPTNSPISQTSNGSLSPLAFVSGWITLGSSHVWKMVSSWALRRLWRVFEPEGKHRSSKDSPCEGNSCGRIEACPSWYLAVETHRVSNLQEKYEVVSRTCSKLNVLHLSVTYLDRVQVLLLADLFEKNWSVIIIIRNCRSKVIAGFRGVAETT